MNKTKDTFILILSVFFILCGIFVCLNEKQANTVLKNDLQYKSDSIKQVQNEYKLILAELFIKDSLLQAEKKNIKLKYETIIKEIPTYELPDFVALYDSSFNTPIYIYNTLACFDKKGIVYVTENIYKGKEAETLLYNCYDIVETKDSIIDAYKGLSETMDIHCEMWEMHAKKCTELYEKAEKDIEKEKRRKKGWRSSFIVSFVANVVQAVL